MNNKKVYNLIHIWEEKGYDIIEVGETYQKSTLIEAKVHFKGNGRPVNFTAEWPAIKELADRQNFYAFPIETCNDKQQSVVNLILKSQIYQLYKRIHDVKTGLYSTYWGIQRDGRVFSHIRELELLTNLFRGFEKDIKKMNSGKEQSLMKDNLMMSTLETLQIKLNNVKVKALESELYLYTELDPLFELVRQYAY